jgi:hypothetical protein
VSESICHDCTHWRSEGAYCAIGHPILCKDFDEDGAVSRVQVDIERLPDPAPTAADLIRHECDALCAMLLEKNRKYGDSALKPIRCFSRADPVEQIRVRLDDKLSRLMRGQGIEDEDVVKDLMGYLVLLRVAQRMRGDE